MMMCINVITGKKGDKAEDSTQDEPMDEASNGVS